MLILERRKGQRIHIGDGITVTVTRVRGQRVTVAVDAPRAVKVLRGELKGKAA
jgi:carbon storage regulator